MVKAIHRGKSSFGLTAIERRKFTVEGKHSYRSQEQEAEIFCLTASVRKRQ